VAAPRPAPPRTRSRSDAGVLADQVNELHERDPDVAHWRADQGVSFRTSAPKHIAHPTAGPLSFGIETVIDPHEPDQRLVVYTVEPGSATAQTLPQLASWTDITATDASTTS
jgi:hypothetical protein